MKTIIEFWNSIQWTTDSQIAVSEFILVIVMFIIFVPGRNAYKGDL